MPIYEYECKDCGHQLEAIQKMSDAALADCPQCSKPALRKLVSAAAFRLKGKGWYETDFKEGDKKKNLLSTESAGSTDIKTESTPDSKVENKTDTKKEAPAKEASKESPKEGAKEKKPKSESKPAKEKTKITSSKSKPTKKKPNK